MKATAKSAKQVQIVATYYHKNVETGELTGVVTYLVRASNGVDTYTTTLVNGKATGCSCPSRSKNGCYHKHGLEQKAVARKEVASQFSAKHAPSWLVELVAKGVLVAPVKVVSKPAQEIVSKVVDISQKGNFGSKPFNLLKVG